MNKKCFIMGLPEAGKTTYLAAFWHTITSLSTYKTKLKLKSVTNEQYLANISQKWVDAQKLERTLPATEQDSILINLETEEGVELNLVVPDLSGETFQKIYEDREIPIDLAENIRGAEAILFFINVDSIKAYGLIPDAYRETGDMQASVKRKPRIPWVDDSVQVHVVELIQFVLGLRKEKPANVSFVLSAWDKVRRIPNALVPKEFFMQCMPMVHQFCVSNAATVIWNVWGISAQGGELDAAKELLEKNTPIDRIIVESSDGCSCCDITLPVFKLIGEC